MDSTDPFAGYGAAAPLQQQQAPTSAPPEDPNDPFSGYDSSPNIAAKAIAAGTTAKPEDAGKTYSDSVKTNTPPQVIKGDPDSFSREQQNKQATAAIDSDPDLSHFIQTVPDAAAISSGDWHTLSNIAGHAAQVGLNLLDEFIYNNVTTPALDYARAGIEDIKQGRRIASYDVRDPYSAAAALSGIRGGYRAAAGLMSIVASPVAPAIEAYVNGLEKLGIPRDQAYFSLMLAVPRVPAEPGRALALPEGRPDAPPKMQGAPGRREQMENIAGYYKEFEPEEIKAWSNDELKSYVNTKLGMGSAAQDLAETQTPKPGADKGFDELHAEQAAVNKDTIDNLVRAVQESKTKERSPEAMEAYLNLKGLGDKQVWLPSDMIAEMYRGMAPHADDKMFGWIDNIASRLPEATEMGTEISVPLSKYLANIDPAVHGELKDFMRLDEALPPEMAKEWIEWYHEKFAEDAEKEDIENMAKPPEERTPSNAGPAEYGVENFLPLREDYKSKPGANVARTMKLLGAKLYGEPTNLDKVTVKELLQNAYDAVKGSLEQGGPPGKIDLEMDEDSRVIRMTDNGHGMSPEVLGKEFLEIAGSKKETTQASGGLGIAKMLFLLENRGLNVVTMRDGKVSELNTHGEELHAAFADPELAPVIKVRAPTAKDRALFPDGQGTHVEVTIPKTYKDTQTGEEKRIGFASYANHHPSLTRSPLFGNISLSVKEPYTELMSPLPVGNAFPADKFTQFPPAKFSWGTAQIYISKDQRPKNESWQENVHYLSNGVWQFSESLKMRPLDFMSENIPHTFYIDVHSKAKPEDPGYPFDLNRQGFTREARKSFEQITNYLATTFQQLDFLSQAKSYGDIQYLTSAAGRVVVSPRTQLEPKVPPSKKTATGLGPADKIEFRGDDMYVNGKKMPSMTKEDLGKVQIKIEELMVDEGLIDPNKVMLHSSMETQVSEAKGPLPKEILQYEDWLHAKGYDISMTPEQVLADPKLLPSQRSWVNEWIRRSGYKPEGEQGWRPLDEVAREKFGPRFDNFMFEVGNVFLRLRDFVAKNVEGYEGLKKEGIGISFDAEYHGVSIRVPFSGSFVNPALTKNYGDPMLEAAGIHGTMVHELAHHKVRAHGVEFEAAMADIQAHVDREMLKILNRMTEVGYNPLGAMNALSKIFKESKDIEDWLRETILDETRTRTRGRRIKGAGEERKPGGEAGVPGGAPGRQVPTGEAIEGRPAQSADLHSPSAQGRSFSTNPTEQLAAILLHAEKKSLYLAPLFRDAKSAGMTQKQWTAYAKKLQGADEADYEKALAAANKEVQKTLEPAYKAEFNEVRREVESDFRSANSIAANNFFRRGILPTGETVALPKLDRAAVGFPLKDITTDTGGLNPDEVAPTFGYDSGRELVQALMDFDRARGRKTPESYINQLVDEEANKRMAEKHGDVRDRIAERAQEIALENHHVDILIDEMKHLAATSGQLPFTLEQINTRVEELFARVPHKEAKYSTYQKAVFKAGRKAEEHLLAGKIDEAFKEKQRQLFAVLGAKLARKFESYKKSQENTFKRLINNDKLSGVEQPYKDFATDLLVEKGYGPPRPHSDHGPLRDFVDQHNGSIAAAYWVYDPTQPLKNPRGNVSTGAHLLYDTMNTEEFTDLAKTIQSLLHNGREEKKINTAYGKANVDNAVVDLVAQQSRYPDKPQPGVGQGFRRGPGETRRQWVARGIRWADAQHLLIERVLDYDDKFEPNGPSSAYIDRPMRMGYNEEVKLQEAAVKKLKYIRDKYVNASIYDEIENHAILDNMNSYKARRLNRMNLRKIIGYAGSKSGREKLIKGFAITEDQLNEIIARNATKEDIEYANARWELMRDLWERSARMQERVTGVSADPLEVKPFDVKLMTGETVHATGGYERINYDKDRGNITEDVMMRGDLFDPDYIAAVTPQSYTIPRTGYVQPLDLGSGLDASHIMGMIHDIAFREPVLNVRKIVLGKAGEPYRMSVARKWGAPVRDAFRGWLKDIANSHTVDDDFARGISRLIALGRQQVISSMIFLKPGVAIKHLLAAMGMSAAQVGARPLISGMYDVGAAGMAGAARDLLSEKGMGADENFVAALRSTADPTKKGSKLRDFIRNSSPLMRARGRAHKNSIREATDALYRAGWKQKFVDTRNVSQAIGRIAVAMSDALSADSEWWAAYQREFDKNGDHDQAVYQGDRAVTRAHGSNFIGDKSAVMRSQNEFVRNIAILFQFFNHFGNNMMQLAWDIRARAAGREEPGANIASISSRFAYYAVMAVLGEAIVSWYYDRESFGKQLLLSAIRLMGSGYFGLNSFVNAVTGGFDPQAGAVGIAMKNAATVIADAKRAFEGRPTHDWLRHMGGAMGTFGGIGGDQVGSTLQGIGGLITGEELPEDIPQAIRQLITGHPRPRTRWRQ